MISTSLSSTHFSKSSRGKKMPINLPLNVKIFFSNKSSKLQWLKKLNIMVYRMHIWVNLDDNVRENLPEAKWHCFLLMKSSPSDKYTISPSLKKIQIYNQLINLWSSLSLFCPLSFSWILVTLSLSTLYNHFFLFHLLFLSLHQNMVYL